MSRKCKVCSSGYSVEVNAMLTNGKDTAKTIIDWLELNTMLEEMPSESALSRHFNEHVKRALSVQPDVQGFLLSDGKIVLANGKELSQVDPQSYLELVITIAAYNALTLPNTVTISDGIKAISALSEGMKSNLFKKQKNTIEELWNEALVENNEAVKKPKRARRKVTETTIEYDNEEQIIVDGEVISYQDLE